MYFLMNNSFMNLNVVGDDSNIVGVDLELKGEVAEGVGIV